METAIGVSNALKVRLAAFKKNHGLATFEQTLSVMLDYFAEVGDDPTKPQFTAKAQMVEMNKRLDQVVRFQQVFEKKKLQPLLNEMEKLVRHVLEVMPGGEVTTKSDMEELLQGVATSEEVANAVMKLYDALNGNLKL